MTDRDTIRRRVNEYRADGDVKLTDENLGATRDGIDQDRRLRRIRADSDEDENSQGAKLDMILSHLDSIHSALADHNERMDALEGKGRADGDDDPEPNDMVDYGKPLLRDGENPEGKPTPLVADRNEKDARRDADYTSREPINGDLPIERSDAGRHAAARFQSRADAVFQAFGDSAARYMAGESLTAYRQRLLSKLKKHSKAWAKADLYRLRDPAALAIAESQIFADAAEYARSPASVPEGVVREVKERDQSGREIIRFYGSPNDVWSAFRHPGRRLVNINLNPDRR